MAAKKPLPLGDADEYPPLELEEGDPIPDSLVEAPLPRPRPPRPGDAPKMAPMPAPDGLPPGSFDKRFNPPPMEKPVPHPVYPQEDRQGLGDLLREALANPDSPLTHMAPQDQDALALALQQDPTGAESTPSQTNPLETPNLMMPGGANAAAAWRRWMQMSQHPNAFPPEQNNPVRRSYSL